MYGVNLVLNTEKWDIHMWRIQDHMGVITVVSVHYRRPSNETIWYSHPVQRAQLSPYQFGLNSTREWIGIEMNPTDVK